MKETKQYSWGNKPYWSTSPTIKTSKVTKMVLLYNTLWYNFLRFDYSHVTKRRVSQHLMQFAKSYLKRYDDWLTKCFCVTLLYRPTALQSLLRKEWSFWLCIVVYVMLCYVMLCYVMLCYVMLCYVMYVMLCYVMLCLLCSVMLCCYVMLCYVMLFYFMLFYVMLWCYVMLCMLS